MKKLLLTLAAGIVLCSCGSHDPQIAIVPYPNHLETGRGTYRVTDRPVTCDSRTDERTQRAVVGFAARLATVTGGTNPVTVADEVPASGIRFVTDESLPAEGYELNVDGEGIEVRASQFPGFLYALQSLEQLLPAAVYGTEPAPDAAWEVPCVKIADAPRFAYRGMHLDVARHFFSVDEVKRYIDVMAIHKLNTLHWHLTDDQGWRIEIKRYPELTAVGSIRKATVVRKEWGTYDGTPYGGFYTQDEIRDVVKYAADRGVTVIPEIDLPGHMLAALTAYPELGCTGGPYEVWGRWGVADDVLCPGREKTFEFLEGVLTEVMELFPSEYIHIGGDECPKVRWEKCPRCQAKIRQLGLKDDGEHTAEHYLQSYVTDRIGKFLAQHGRRIIGWDEILEGRAPSDAVVMSWRGSEGGIAAAKLGHDVIMTPNSHFYFDYYQSLDTDAEPFGIGGYIPMEQVYSYDPAFPELTPEQQKHILGVQANLWTEYVLSDEHLEYMLLPRLAALSEVQWCQPETKDWNRFIGSFRMDEIYSQMGYEFAKHIFGVTASYAVDPEKGGVVMTLTTQGGADPLHARRLRSHGFESALQGAGDHRRKLHVQGRGPARRHADAGLYAEIRFQQGDRTAHRAERRADAQIYLRRRLAAGGRLPRRSRLFERRVDRVPERAAGRYDRHAGGEALFGGDRRIAGREGRVGFPAFVGGGLPLGRRQRVHRGGADVRAAGDGRQPRRRQAVQGALPRNLGPLPARGGPYGRSDSGMARRGRTEGAYVRG